MPRPTRCRRICKEPDYDNFRPDGQAGAAAVTLSVDEYEVIRLIDLEKQTHLQCAKLMDISRTTVTEIYETARYKLADCVVNGKVLQIAGGNYRLCDGKNHFCWKQSQSCLGEMSEINIVRKGDKQMRIAVTYENGEIFQHFGHTEQFKLYDIEAGKIANAQVVDTMGSGHGALAGFLAKQGVDQLICGGIGGGAQNALIEAGIKLYGGVSGNADQAVEALISGGLNYNPDVKCDHHEHDHGEGHSCGSHSCGGSNHNC